MPKIIENPRESILQHAKSILVGEGHDGLTIREVAKRSGISVGTIYNYFPTKKDIVIQLMWDYWNSYLEEVDEISTSNLDLNAKLLQTYDKLATFIKTFQEVWLRNTTEEQPQEAVDGRRDFMIRLTRKVETMILEYYGENKESIFADTYTIAEFVVMNFYMMALTNQFEYNKFEKILKKLFD